MRPNCLSRRSRYRLAARRRAEAYAEEVAGDDDQSKPAGQQPIGRLHPAELLGHHRRPHATSEEHAGRVKRYAITMAFRTACFIAMIFVPGVWRWVLFACAVFLPYVAVLLANQAHQRGMTNPVENAGPGRHQTAHHRTRGDPDDHLRRARSTTRPRASDERPAHRCPLLLARPDRSPATAGLRSARRRAAGGPPSSTCSGTTRRSTPRTGASTGWPAPSTASHSGGFLSARGFLRDVVELTTP